MSVWMVTRDAVVSSRIGGATGARTPDLLHAMQMLSQLSYRPIFLHRICAQRERMPDAMSLAGLAHSG